MQMVTRILCPTDFSSSANLAVDYAEQLARDTGAELFLFHAFDLPESWSLSGQEHPRDPALERRLGSVLSSSNLNEKIHRVLHAGNPGEVICWTAQEQKCDLIVMGTHGRTGLTHLIFGSVAEFVLKHARCPVLTVRDRDPNELPLKRPSYGPILAPRYM